MTAILTRRTFAIEGNLTIHDLLTQPIKIRQIVFANIAMLVLPAPAQAVVEQPHKNSQRS